MTLRAGHGVGRGMPRVEVLPADELPSASHAETDGLQRSADGRFAAGNTVARASRLRPRQAGAVAAALADPKFLPFARWGRRYGAHRRRELAAAHGGGISAGVGAIVESAALDLAASRYLQALGVEGGDPALLRMASQLAQTARQHELAAWELAARECATRPAGDPLAAARARIAAIAESAAEDDDDNAAAGPSGAQVRPAGGPP